MAESPQPARIDQQRNPARHGIFQRLLRGFVAALLVWMVAAAALFWWALSDVRWSEIADGSLRTPQVTQADEPLPVEAGSVELTPLSAMAPHLIDAVLATEDRRFYEHHGVDLRGIARAAWRNYDAGEVVEGGSTITQQLVKVLYLDRERTYKRKLQEVVIALWLEWRLGKDEVLTRYLNSIYLGAGATGVTAAARTYFGVEPSDVSLWQAATIAGAIRAPSILNPQANPEASAQRARTVLNAMVDDGRITQAEAEAAIDAAQ